MTHPGDFDLLTSAGNSQPAPRVPPAPLAESAVAKSAPATGITAASIAKGKSPIGRPELAYGRLPFAKEIGLAAKNNGIDILLLTAVVKTESRFDASAVSPRGAVGLMQIRPDLDLEGDPEKLLDPAHNLQRGAAYLRDMLDLFGGDLRLALAAYNAGPNAVRRFGGLPPYAETEAFVAKVLGTYVELHKHYEPGGQLELPQRGS